MRAKFLYSRPNEAPPMMPQVWLLLPPRPWDGKCDRRRAGSRYHSGCSLNLLS